MSLAFAKYIFLGKLCVPCVYIVHYMFTKPLTVINGTFTEKKWYFVTKIVLTYCEKKLF